MRVDLRTGAFFVGTIDSGDLSIFQVSAEVWGFLF